jgi:hypothetical protein
MAGQQALREALRMGESTFKAVGKKGAARKDAMRDRYSCFVPTRGVRYRVVKRYPEGAGTGDARALSQHVELHHRPDGRTG